MSRSDCPVTPATHSIQSAQKNPANVFISHRHDIRHTGIHHRSAARDCGPLDSAFRSEDQSIPHPLAEGPTPPVPSDAVSARFAVPWHNVQYALTFPRMDLSSLSVPLASWAPPRLSPVTLYKILLTRRATHRHHHRIFTTH